MRLEALGFPRVFDYAAGKKDWLSEGMPAEGERAGDIRAGGLARPGAPTCHPGDQVGSLADRGDIEDWGMCVVTDEEGIVHGLIHAGDIDSADPGASVDESMELAPWSRRPTASLDDTAERLEKREKSSVLITTSRGRLLGVLFLEDIRRHLEESGE